MTRDVAFAQGMVATRRTLAQWRGDPWPLLSSWLLGALAIASGMLIAVLAISSWVPPDVGLSSLPAQSTGTAVGPVADIVGRNSLVLALHAFACVAGFIAGSSLPLSAAARSGLSRWVHERARPLALAWVIAVTCFSLITQALALGAIGSSLAADAGLSPGVLLLTAAPHAVLELTAVFLPLAAWMLASRRGEWDQLLAASLITVAVAIPLLLAAATWEVYVWPQILGSVSAAY